MNEPSTSKMGLPCDWQISKQKVTQRGKYLLKTGQWSDCKFIVGQEPQQQILDAHRLFLAMSSPVFEAMFFGSMAEKNDPIPIRDVQPEAFKTLLEYIYTDHIELESFELACELCYCAKKYMLPFLVEECTKYLWSDLSPKKACRAFEFAKLFEEPVLLEKCLQIICTKTNEVLNESSWDDVEYATISTLFDQDELRIDSEVELFDAVEQWARAECNRRNLMPSDPKALRSVTGNSIQKIRFLTLTPQQFAEGPGKSQLLSRDEAFAILMNVSSSGSDIPMPEGFSTNRLKRKNLEHKPISGPYQVNPNWNNMFGPMPSSISPQNMFRSGSRTFDGSLNQCKNYCRRAFIHTTDCLNVNVLDCSVTFIVDKNISVIGVQVPTQIPSTDFQMPTSSQYTEILYAHLLDADGSRLTYTHFTTTATFNCVVEIGFNQPAYIQRNKVYRVGVIFNKTGSYPVGNCSNTMICNGVHFTFGIGGGEESFRDGFIRSIVFRL